MNQPTPFVITLAVATLSLLASATAARAQVACGGSVAPGETVTLTADLGPCDGVDAAVIVGGILDLGGRTVSCADSDGNGALPDGIVLLGLKAQVRNGTIAGCYYNVYVGDRGRHTVENVTSTAAAVYGIFVETDTSKNRIIGNTASGNGDDGIQVRGSKNTITGNVTDGNGEDGIDLTQATKNKVTGNTSTNNVDDGIEATGTKNKITGNTATTNGDNGIAVGDKGNKVIGNTATGNAERDILAQEPCKRNKFKNNTFGSGSSCVK